MRLKELRIVDFDNETGKVFQEYIPELDSLTKEGETLTVEINGKKYAIVSRKAYDKFWSG